ncbi:hypothetical protein HPB47_015343 [Ixodes persulcatus]|uniref:Uncharacterized protein n=1 Tax=Ixodes persulcatus TaxID=34615 RepID=A0AC60QTR5_IXOPE|nr:hypothetical protein HPB47_015343 [Ixodes persulcatus]
MLRYMTLLLAASTFGNGATVDDFNDYVDRAIGSSLPPLIRNAHSIYPEARIPFHTFEVSEEFVWQNDIEVRLTEGAVKGLDVVTERRGSCSNPSQVMGATISTCTLDLSGLEATYTLRLSEELVWQNDIEVRLTEGVVKRLDVVTERSGSCSHPSRVMGAMVTTCTLDLSGLQATYTAQTDRGEHIFAKRKRFSVDVSVASATVSIVLASNGDRNARLVSFHLNHTRLEMSYDRDFDLDSLREEKFGDEVMNYTRSELIKIIEGSYFTALSQAFTNTCFAYRRFS